MNKLISIGILVILLTIIISIGTQDYFYEMRKTNCDDILRVEYAIPNEQITSCIRFNNYPFWEFYFPYYFTPIIMELVLIIGVWFAKAIVGDM